MLKRTSFDPAWIMLLAVIATLVTMNFIDDEHARDMLALIVLSACLLLFIASILIHSFSNRIS